MAGLAMQGLTLDRVWHLTGLAALLSNLVSNVPAVMLLVKFLDPRAAAAVGRDRPWPAPLPAT